MCVFVSVCHIVCWTAQTTDCSTRCVISSYTRTALSCMCHIVFRWLVYYACSAPSLRFHPFACVALIHSSEVLYLCLLFLLEAWISILEAQAVDQVHCGRLPKAQHESSEGQTLPEQSSAFSQTMTGQLTCSMEPVNRRPRYTGVYLSLVSQTW